MPKRKEPIIWFAGFERWIKSRKFYEGYSGITLLGKRFLGFNISNKTYIRKEEGKLFDFNKTETDVVLWVYLFFYNIMIRVYNKKNYEE